MILSFGENLTEQVMSQTSWDILDLCCDGTEAIIAIIIALKLFNNLLECGDDRKKCKYCCVQHSDRHNWIIHPSTTTKNSSIISVLFYFIYSIIWFSFNMEKVIYHSGQISDWTPHNRYIPAEFDDFLIIPNAFGNMAKCIYSYYLLSTILHYIKQNALFEKMIPNKLIITIKIFIVLHFVSFWINMILRLVFGYHRKFLFGIPFQFIYYIIQVTDNLIIDALFLRLYYRGLNNIAHFWYNKNPNQYFDGENDKIHEILIVITRCIVIGIFSLVLDLITIVIYIFYLYIQVSNKSKHVIYGIYDISHMLDIITYLLAIYFIFEFGHADYLRICGICHNCMYKKCRRKHNIQVQNGFYVELQT